MCLHFTCALLYAFGLSRDYCLIQTIWCAVCIDVWYGSCLICHTEVNTVNQNKFGFFFLYINRSELVIKPYTFAFIKCHIRSCSTNLTLWNTGTCFLILNDMSGLFKKISSSKEGFLSIWALNLWVIWDIGKGFFFNVSNMYQTYSTINIFQDFLWDCFGNRKTWLAGHSPAKFQWWTVTMEYRLIFSSKCI